MQSLEYVNQLPTLPPRPADSNKGTFGRVFVVAGSKGMSGAAVLCGCAALRGGAGLVYVAVPESILSAVAAGNPCYLTVPLPTDDRGRLASSAEVELLDAADIVGPPTWSYVDIPTGGGRRRTARAVAGTAPAGPVRAPPARPG